MTPPKASCQTDVDHTWWQHDENHPCSATDMVEHLNQVKTRSDCIHWCEDYQRWKRIWQPNREWWGEGSGRWQGWGREWSRQWVWWCDNVHDEFGGWQWWRGQLRTSISLGCVADSSLILVACLPIHRLCRSITHISACLKPPYR